MLGLLMMAGLGFAATAFIDHMDSQSSEEDNPQDEDDHASSPHGSLLDEQEERTESDEHFHGESSTHSASDEDHGGHEVVGDHEHAPHQVTDGPDKTEPAPKDQAPHKVFGDEGDDRLHGSARGDLMEGKGGDDKLFGHRGDDHLIGFDEGYDTLNGGAGNDSLHGYMAQKQGDDWSYVVEDHQADVLHGGLGKDTLFLGSDDSGSGGQGADSFHVSWDVEHGHPAQITDYNPKQDKIYVEFTSNHADEGMTDSNPEEQTITTEPMTDGEGTSILMNGQAIAHVLGALHLHAADIGLIRS